MKRLVVSLSSILALLTNCPAKELELTLSPVWEGTKVRFEGKSNLPDGTKLGVDLTKQGKVIEQDWKIIVESGSFKSKTFGGDSGPITGSYKVKLFTHFTCCNWQKNMQIVNELKTYTGEYIKLENPDLVDSDKILECVKEFVLEPKLTEADQAIEMVKGYYITKEGLGKSSEPIEKAIKSHGDVLAKAMKTWVKYYDWRTEPVAGKAGVYNVYFDFEFGVDVENKDNRVPTKKTAFFECDLNTKQVRCRNKMANNSAWIPDY